MAVCVGIIIAAHGVKGGVKIKSFTQEPESLLNYAPLSNDKGEEIALTKLGLAKDGVILASIKGVTDRNAAEALKGTKLFAKRKALPVLAAEEYYHADLLGLEVYDQEDRLLGKITAIHDFGAGDVLELDNGTLIPFTHQCVPIIDLIQGKLWANPLVESE